MLRNFLIIAFRNLWKYRFYSFLNIFGLALGMACCLLILLHVRKELSYDRFHERPGEVYRLTMRLQTQDGFTDYPMTGYPWARLIRENIPQATASTCLLNGAETKVSLDAQRFEQQRLLFGDSTYTTIFHLDFLAGNPAACLRAPNTVVLSESTARRYFGSASPLQRLLRVDVQGKEVEMEVTGVVQDYPETSHFHFDLLASTATLIQAFGGPDQEFFRRLEFNMAYTYLRTTDPEAVQQGLSGLYEKQVDKDTKEFLKGLFMQPLTGIHLDSRLIGELETNSNGLLVRVFLFVGILTLIIACINFVNLSTALSANRSKEVGMRKVVGAGRRHLIGQFMGESGILALLALVCALLFAEGMRRVVQSAANVEIRLQYFSDPFAWWLLLVILLFTGLAAGSYPALVLSGFRPKEVLSGQLRSGAKGGLIRKTLVVLQFVISTALIIGAFVFLRQLNYLQTMEMGFGRDWRVVIPVQLDNQERQVQVIERLKELFRQNSGVVGVTASNSVPGQPRALTPVHVTGQPEDRQHRPVTLPVDFDYVETMGLQIIEGRAFDRQYGTDSTEALLVNETALQALELPTPAVGAEITYTAGQFIAGGASQARIIGVFRDMRFEPAYRETYPMLLRILPNQYSTLIVHIRPEDKDATLHFLEESWNRLVPEQSFQFSFLEDDLAALYQNDRQLGRMVTLFAVLAIIIACLGLFGLSAFTTALRRREVSIRKVLGASVSGIVGLLSKESLVLVLLAFPLAALLAWWATGIWLRSFAFRVQIGPEIYLLAALITLAIAFLTVSYHSLRAARANPGEALHRE